jgi:signal peptide peptidase SppA
VFDGTNLGAVIPLGDLWMLETSRAIREVERFQSMSGKEVAKMSARCARMAEAASSPNGMPQMPKYGVISKTAVVKIDDIMTKKPHSMMDMMGGTSTIQVRQQLRHAVLKNASIENVWLNLDSPGGDQDGAFDLAEDVARLSKVKPIFGYVDGSCMSACLLVGSQCSALYSTRGSHTGSLGAYTQIVDLTGEDAKMGRKVYIIKAGDQKAIGAGGPVTNRQLAIVQARIDAIHQLFIQAVASGRSMNLDMMAQVSDASIYLGKDAVKVGLVDGIMNVDEFEQMVVHGGEAPKGKVYPVANNTNKRPRIASWLHQDDDDDDDGALLAQVAQPKLKPRHYQLLSQLAAAGIKSPEDLDDTLQMAQTGHQALLAMRGRVKALAVVALGATMAQTVEASVMMADLQQLRNMSTDFIQAGVRQGLLTADGQPAIRKTAPALFLPHPGGVQPYGQQDQQPQPQQDRPQHQQVFSVAADEDPRANLGQPAPDPLDEARQVLLTTPELGTLYSL